ncbi:MAG: UDP-glucose 4-epimerase GalE [Opitutales bacterium]|nr:UDP-glucose 4-epimerase GalE [Opitutales bacterium]
MNVLVIGGAGYIGSHCVRQLIEAGHRPVVLDNMDFGHRKAVAPEVPFYEGDLGDSECLGKILEDEKIELVMHFAAYLNVGESVNEPLKYYNNNVAKPIRMLQTMLNKGVKKLVFSSTCATYGIPERVPMTEDLPQSPINPYGQTKLDVENMLKLCAKAYGISFAAFRYFNASGAAADGIIGEDHTPECHLIPLAIWAALGKIDHLTVFGDDYPTPDGTCLRDYIHVDDLSRAHIAVFDKLNTPGAQYFYNLGTGTPASVMEVIKTVEEVTGLKVPYEMGKRRAGDPPALYADSSKAQAELGWEIQYPTLKGIVETAWKWHQSHPDGYKD